jgi:hypothetical protein
MGGASVDRPPSLICPRVVLGARHSCPSSAWRTSRPDVPHKWIAAQAGEGLRQSRPPGSRWQQGGIRSNGVRRDPLRMGHDFFREGLLQRKPSLAGAWVARGRGIFETALLEIR